MKIIIDIPEEKYEIIKKIVKNQNSICPEVDSAEKIILNGTPLPKGHGRIIDESQIPGDGSWDFSDRLDETPTIIEADEEVEE